MTRLEVALPILQGLLASGHYDRFKSDMSEAVSDALGMADELMAEDDRKLNPPPKSQDDTTDMAHTL